MRLFNLKLTSTEMLVIKYALRRAYFQGRDRKIVDNILKKMDKIASTQLNKKRGDF